MSRSVSLVAAYLMAITCLSLEQVLCSIKGARNFICVNCSFQSQLKNFETCDLPNVLFLNFMQFYSILGIKYFIQNFRFGNFYKNVLASQI